MKELKRSMSAAKDGLVVFLESFITTVRIIPYFSRISTDTKLVSSWLPISIFPVFVVSIL